MFPLIGGLLSGASSLLGGIFSSNTSASNTQAQIQAQEQMQNQTEQYNATQAQENRDFQQQMSSTAYQRASKDMTEAGLNPMMMFGSGGPASVPGGATASVGTPSVPMPQNTSPFAKLGEAVERGLNSAIEVKTIDKMSDEIANLKAQNDLITAQAGTQKQLTSQARSKADVDAATVGQRIRQIAAGTAPLETTAKEAAARGALPDWMRTVKGGTDLLGGAFSALGDAAGSAANSAFRFKSMAPKRTTSESTTEHFEGGSRTFNERWDNLGVGNYRP